MRGSSNLEAWWCEGIWFHMSNWWSKQGLHHHPWLTVYKNRGERPGRFYCANHVTAYQSSHVCPAAFHSQTIQGEHVDELTLVCMVVHRLHSLCVALYNTGHWHINLVISILSWGFVTESNICLISIYYVCGWFAHITRVDIHVPQPPGMSYYHNITTVDITIVSRRSQRYQLVFGIL